MALAKHGVTTFEGIGDLGADKLTEIVGDRQRAEALLEAIDQEIDIVPNRYSVVHEKLGQQLGIGDIVSDCGSSMELDYEKAIGRLLGSVATWKVSVRDDGKKRNEPDFVVRLDNIAIMLEVKTAPGRSGLVKKEKAFAVLQKGSDYGEEFFRVTLGKPHFDEMSKSKAIASKEITLVEHVAFLEGMLRVLSGNITARQFLEWLTVPGEAELRRLPGKATYLLV